MVIVGVIWIVLGLVYFLIAHFVTADVGKDAKTVFNASFNMVLGVFLLTTGMYLVMSYYTPQHESKLQIKRIEKHLNLKPLTYEEAKELRDADKKD